MKQITAWQTTDGKIYLTHSGASKAQEDIIGEELDGLFKVFNFQDMGMVSLHRGSLRAMSNKPLLRAALQDVLTALTPETTEDDDE